MAIRVQVTFDAHEPQRLAQFWVQALGYVRQPPPPGFDTWDDFARRIGLPEDRWHDFDAAIDPDGAGPRLFFQRVPEGKTTKNRVHLDLNVGAEVSDPAQRRSVVRQRSEQLVEAGGSVLREVDEPTGWCIVMTDPEGNEFCVL